MMIYTTSPPYSRTRSPVVICDKLVPYQCFFFSFINIIFFQLIKIFGKPVV